MESGWSITRSSSISFTIRIAFSFTLTPFCHWMQLWVNHPTLLLYMTNDLSMILKKISSGIDLFLPLLPFLPYFLLFLPRFSFFFLLSLFLRLIFLLDSLSHHSSFTNVRYLKKIQLFMDALTETPNILQESSPLISRGIQRYDLFLKLSVVFLDKLIVNILKVLPLDPYVFFIAGGIKLFLNQTLKFFPRHTRWIVDVHI